MTLPRNNSLSARSARRRTVMFLLVALLHAGLIFGPLWMFDFWEKRKPKENMFRVRIGATELSKGPVTGMPERRPPRPPAPPLPPEPVIPVKPAPRIPAEPRVPVIKPKPKPRPKPRLKPKKKPKPQPKRNFRPEPRVPVKKRVVKPRPEPKVPVKKRVVKPLPKRQTPVRKKVVKPKRDPMDDVYRDPNPPNLNPRVPVGRKDRAQQYAPKADHKAPGGGKKVDEALWAKYGQNVERYIYSRWTEPPRSLLGDELPETVIQITIEANGRVSAAKIIRASGNPSMEASVQALLASLDLLPRPPEGRITFRITLKTR